jgi:hypothetical protein
MSLMDSGRVKCIPESHPPYNYGQFETDCDVLPCLSGVALALLFGSLFCSHCIIFIDSFTIQQVLFLHKFTQPYLM